MMFTGFDKKSQSKFKNAFLIFTISQFFMLLGLLDFGTSIKALSDWLIIFTLLQFVGFILIIVSSIKIYGFNKNYFYFFITSIICLFVSLLSSIGAESTEDFTIAWARGLTVSSDILLCIVYAYFFLGSKEYFIEHSVSKNIKRSKIGFIVVIVLTIIINLLVFIGSFSGIRTNYVASAIFKYSALLMKFIMYTFMVIVLILMMAEMKKEKGVETAHEEQ